MTNKLASTLMLSVLTWLSIVWAEERPGKAVYEISPETGMKISDVALKNIDVQTEQVTEPISQRIPAEALVYFKDQTGVYRLRDGWFKLVVVKVLEKEKPTS